MNIENMPKIVLHLHLDGSLDIKLVEKWLKEDIVNMSLEDIKKQLQVSKDCRNLNEYLEKFSFPCSLLQTKEHLYEATYNLLLNLHNMGVIYAEIRFAPSKHVVGGLTYDEVLKSVIEGLNKAKKDTGMFGGIILCCMRDESKETNLKVVELAKKYLNDGVCGIDLAGAEALYPTSNFEYIFDKARELKIPYTIHAGEADGINSINKAIEFKTKRIGHGVRAIDDIKTMNLIKEKNILLEICLTSNLQTEAIKGKHPLEDLYNYGINISINTDNDTVSDININEEYKKVLETTNLSIQDLIKCNINSIDYIFANNEIKNKLKNKLALSLDKC